MNPMNNSLQNYRSTGNSNNYNSSKNSLRNISKIKTEEKNA